MSSVSDRPIDLLGLDAAAWRSHVLHSADRVWPETNCYVDVWIELLNAFGHPPQAALAFTVLQDFEGDHFTFFKFPLEDLQALFGLTVQELAIYDTLEAHIIGQLQRGRVVLVEVDSHWLADVGAPVYRSGHVKTSIAAIAIDPVARRLGYFHNTGYHVLQGDDYEGLFRRPPAPGALFPYAEFIKRDGRALAGAELVAASVALLHEHLGRRPAVNPVTAWRAALPDHLACLAERGIEYFHLYAFNLPRQLGANFEMMGSYLRWLGENGESGLGEAEIACRRIAEGAKAVQFQLARMANRGKFNPEALALAPIDADYDDVLSTLVARFG